MPNCLARLSVAQRLISLILLLAGVTLLVSGCGDEAEARPTVTLAQDSVVQGVVRNDVDEYRGIRYGEATRWELAKPVALTSGKLDASNFGAACAQPVRFQLTEESLSEDCLFLNVSMPRNTEASAKLPVFVWIHGGAFVGGDSNLYRLDKLAREGKMVVVSINYRLGIFGFMPHPAINDGWNGNLGLEDQRLAMRWVKDNIEAFGGDPKNITVAGESAGGGSVCMHLLSGEKSAGLFDKAMVQSAACLYPLPMLAQALHPDGGDQLALWSQLTKNVGCSNNPQGTAEELACLKGKTGDAAMKQLLAAQNEIDANSVMSFAPSIASGSVPLPDYNPASVEKYLNRVPILAGGTEDEMRLYVAYTNLFEPKWPVESVPEEGLKTNWLAQFYPGLSDEQQNRIVKKYTMAPLTNGGAIGSMLSDFNPVAGINNCSYLYASAEFSRLTSVYQWEFADPDAPVLGVGIAKGLDPKMALGPVHSSELNYFFPNLSNTKAIDGPYLKPDSQRLADTLVQVVASFVKTGNPGLATLPTWNRFSGFESEEKTGVQQVMRFESPTKTLLEKAYDNHQCGFWRDLYPQRFN